MRRPADLDVNATPWCLFQWDVSLIQLLLVQEIYDRGFTNMEKSHQKVLMEMRQTHKRELDQLRLEKDQLLAEETKATQAGESGRRGRAQSHSATRSCKEITHLSKPKTVFFGQTFDGLDAWLQIWMHGSEL